MKIKLSDLASLKRCGSPKGITSVCSAHPVVIRAALRYGKSTSTTVLIEATCNQVNHLGGYTGMRPVDFASLVYRLAEEEKCPIDQIVLGGDHLGPNPWRHLPADEAMEQAELMVNAYIAAGFRKIHLDASMGCLNEPAALDDETTAHRAARLAAVAEKTALEAGGALPVYVIGTEVPPPGGADHTLTTIEPTDAEAAKQTIAIHRLVFAKAGLTEAFSRAIGLVVQPGVEFGNRNVICYDQSKVGRLTRVLSAEPQFVFEAHSTDYQGTVSLAQLVNDGFPILKVGPELTFVLREALYALDAMASDFSESYGDRPLYAAMEALMLAQPQNWNRHYHGDDAELRLLRHYSLSDRIRYYWATPEAQAAVGHLFDALRGRVLPITLFWQHMPAATHFADVPLDPEAVLIWRVTQSLAAYQQACGTIV